MPGNVFASQSLIAAAYEPQYSKIDLVKIKGMAIFAFGLD
jgi:hypothetical protein